MRYFKWVPPTSARILDARVIGKVGAQGEFLTLDYSAPEQLNFNVLALNKGDSARVSILCSSDSPSVDAGSVRVEGVIKGAELVEASRNFNASQQPSFIHTVFAGGVWTNIAKGITFFLMGLVVILAVLIPIGGIEQRISARKAEKARRESEEKQKQLVERLSTDLVKEGDLKNLAKQYGEPFSDTDIEYMAKAVAYFRDLTPEQLRLCQQILKEGKAGDISDVILKQDFTAPEKALLAAMPDPDNFFSSIYRFRTLYKPEFVPSVLLKDQTAFA